MNQMQSYQEFQFLLKSYFFSKKKDFIIRNWLTCKMLTSNVNSLFLQILGNKWTLKASTKF